MGVGTYYAAWIIYFGFAFVQFFGEGKFATLLKYLLYFILFTVSVQTLSMLTFYLFFYK